MQKILPPDYDKVDVSANGFSLTIAPEGVDMSNASEFDLSDMDYRVNTFTDSAYLHDCWTTALEEALDQYRENMAKRAVVMQAKKGRLRRSQVVEDPAAISSNSASLSCAADDSENGGTELIDLRFVS